MVTNITSLTGNGLRDWLIQRISSVIVACYSIFIIVYFISHSEITFETWHELFQQNWMRVFSIITLLSLLLHSWIGVWTVTTDYLPKLAVRLTIQMLVLIALLAYLIWGITILWGI